MLKSVVAVVGVCLSVNIVSAVKEPSPDPSLLRSRPLQVLPDVVDYDSDSDSESGTQIRYVIDEHGCAFKYNEETRAFELIAVPTAVTSTDEV